MFYVKSDEEKGSFGLGCAGFSRRARMKYPTFINFCYTKLIGPLSLTRLMGGFATQRIYLNSIIQNIEKANGND